MSYTTEPVLDPRAAWLARIRELRLAGHTLPEARAVAGPMPGRDPDRAAAEREFVRELFARREPALAIAAEARLTDLLTEQEPEVT